MAAYDKRAKRRPSAPGPVEGNLARKLDRHELDRRELERELDRSGRMDFDELYERRLCSKCYRNNYLAPENPCRCLMSIIIFKDFSD